jgi:osmotically-inducible protein OsmY
MTSDKRLQELVLEELGYEPRVDAAHIGVTARDGVVTLSGHVSSYAEKLAAEEAARSVHGVKAIAEEIEVRLPWQKKTADDEIARRAVDILSWLGTLPADRIRVRVAHGVVTLEGEVDWQYEKQEAERAVHKLTGVVAVVNAIRIKPSRQMPDVVEVRRQIEAAFKRQADLEASQINVVASDGKLTLTGNVRARHERVIAETAAWAVPGVTAVDDRITIQPLIS